MADRYIADPVRGLIPAHEFYIAKATQVHFARSDLPCPMVVSDTKPYASPITGEIIDGRSARREDLKKHGCIEAGDMPTRQFVTKEKYANITGLPLKGRDI